MRSTQMHTSSTISKTKQRCLNKNAINTGTMSCLTIIPSNFRWSVLWRIICLLAIWGSSSISRDNIFLWGLGLSAELFRGIRIFSFWRMWLKLSIWQGCIKISIFIERGKLASRSCIFHSQGRLYHLTVKSTIFRKIQIGTSWGWDSFSWMLEVFSMWNQGEISLLSTSINRTSYGSWKNIELCMRFIVKRWIEPWLKGREPTTLIWDAGFVKAITFGKTVASYGAGSNPFLLHFPNNKNKKKI